MTPITDDDELLRGFRAAVPQPGEQAWAAVRAALAREIAAEGEYAGAAGAARPGAARRGAPGRGMAGRWRSRRVLGVALAGVLLTGAVAYGARTLIGVGSPAPNPPSAFAPSHVELLGLRVADPGGGSPWGLRLALRAGARFAGRGTVADVDVAIQIGRIRAGEMGFVGEDGVFHDDHLFHAAGPNSALITPANYPIGGTPQRPDLRAVYHFALTLPGVASGYEGCSEVKVPAIVRESKHEFRQDERSLERELALLAAGGSAARRAARSFGASVATMRLELAEQLARTREQASGFVGQRTFATCPARDLRTLVFGFAGPASTSVAIAGRGVDQTERLRPDDDGFYLFVLPGRWSYGSRYQATVTCRDGRSVTGAAAPGTPDAPYCKG